MSSMGITGMGYFCLSWDDIIMTIPVPGVVPACVRDSFAEFLFFPAEIIEIGDLLTKSRFGRANVLHLRLCRNAPGNCHTSVNIRITSGVR